MVFESCDEADCKPNHDPAKECALPQATCKATKAHNDSGDLHLLEAHHEIDWEQSSTKALTYYSEKFNHLHTVGNVMVTPVFGQVLREPSSVQARNAERLMPYPRQSCL